MLLGRAGKGEKWAAQVGEKKEAAGWAARLIWGFLFFWFLFSFLFQTNSNLFEFKSNLNSNSYALNQIKIYAPA
jgi:hypothetical protein